MSTTRFTRLILGLLSGWWKICEARDEIAIWYQNFFVEILTREAEKELVHYWSHFFNSFLWRRVLNACPNLGFFSIKSRFLQIVLSEMNDLPVKTKASWWYRSWVGRTNALANSVPVACLWLQISGPQIQRFSELLQNDQSPDEFWTWREFNRWGIRGRIYSLDFWK